MVGDHASLMPCFADGSTCFIFSFLVCFSSEYADYRGNIYGDYTGASANESRVLDALLKGYDKRLRTNYKGKLLISSYISLKTLMLQY